jgi:hypothetical protein
MYKRSWHLARPFAAAALAAIRECLWRTQRQTPRLQCVNSGPGVAKRYFRSLQTQRNVPALALLKLQRKRKRQLSLGTRAGVDDSPWKHTGPVPVHPWQRAWFMAWDSGLRGETGLRHRPGLILTPAVSHTWVPLGPRHVFFYHLALWPQAPQ